MEDFKGLFKKFKALKVGVIGDVMLDTYMWGHVERISPEAPVPVVSLDKKEYRIGGAGNVALNIASLGAKPYVISVTGDDEEAHRLASLYRQFDIDDHYSIRSKKRITTNKTRIIGRNQQMMRLDAELTNDLERMDEEALLSSFEKFVAEVQPDIIILEDYNKGVLTEAVIRSVISICKQKGIKTAVDPKRKHFFEYRGVDLFKPNMKEVKEALNLIQADTDLLVLRSIHAELKNLLKHQVSFITLSDKGVFYEADNHAMIIPSHLRNIADVSGAGDTVIAAAALVYAATGNVHLMAEVANIAGGLVCEVVGTAAIDSKQLLHECELLLA